MSLTETKDSKPLLGDVPTPIVYHPVSVQRRSAWRWLSKAILVAVGLWIVTSFFSSMDFIHKPHVQNLAQFEYPIPSDVQPHRCITAWPHEMKNPAFSSYPYSAFTSFDFSLPSTTLLLLSKGGLSNGRLKITSSPEITDQVRVNVTVNYYKAAIRDLAKVCMIEREEGESGVGIFTPRPWRSRSYTDRLSFDVELILPLAKSVRRINALSTDVDNFSHDVGSLIGFNFRDISLRASNGKIQAELLAAEKATLASSNAAITVDSLDARTAGVRTTNGRVSGTYFVSDSLDLRTSNAPINVAVAGHSSDTKKPVNLVMHTSNGALDCVVDLDTTSSKAGTFHVEAQTSNAGLKAEIASAPLNSVITVDAKTSNHQAIVRLPSTYEGRFLVSTSNAPVAVEQANPDEQDPACESDRKCDGRRRTVQASSVIKKEEYSRSRLLG
ncbi:hypothetical protein MVEN_00592600 [Mycena venus]|uniref:DUF7330 domain-containing protein n=1 Tax=Mycena venus TaxID=2733690 RepID=A0A8H6YR65_9AGAR|nr:hypothetical protein MVEN_00592600 [Mycena venus]